MHYAQKGSTEKEKEKEKENAYQIRSDMTPTKRASERTAQHK